MTEREKIIDVLNKNFTQDVECTPIYTTAQGKEVALPQELCDIFNDIVTQAVIPYFADALIAAGIGDVKRHRVFVSKDGKEVKQFYSGEEVENILKERNELKVELRDKVDYIHEQDEVIKEYKHRAEVAERALLRACKVNTIFAEPDVPNILAERVLYEFYIRQSEKELAEESKDD